VGFQQYSSGFLSYLSAILTCPRNNDGPRGICIAPEAQHTQLRKNIIHVDGEAVGNVPR